MKWLRVLRKAGATGGQQGTTLGGRRSGYSHAISQCKDNTRSLCTGEPAPVWGSPIAIDPLSTSH